MGIFRLRASRHQPFGLPLKMTALEEEGQGQGQGQDHPSLVTGAAIRSRPVAEPAEAAGGEGRPKHGGHASTAAITDEGVQPYCCEKHRLK